MSFSRTPLHAAAFAGHIECVQLLLAHDATVEDVDQSGRSALLLAAERGRVEVVGTYFFAVSSIASPFCFFGCENV